MTKLALILMTAVLGCSFSVQNMPVPAVKAFTNATILSDAGRPAITKGLLTVRNGKVDVVGPSGNVRLPAGAEIIDLTGKFIIPGMISSHVHISDVQGIKPPAYTEENTLRQLRLFARYGVTAVLSLGGEQSPAFKIRDARYTPSIDYARFYLSGDVITGRTPEEGRQNVARVAALKPDIIKIRVDDNLGTTSKMAPETYTAIIDESHRRGLRVAAHIFYLNDAKAVLKAGADMIAHSVRDQDIDAEFISLMKDRQIPYCPTLTRELSAFVYESTPPFFSDPFFLKEADRDLLAQLQEPPRQQAMKNSTAAQKYKAALVVAQRNLKKAIDAGLLVAMGTDSGAFANRFEGYFEHIEMEMMAESGLTPIQILQAATRDAARALRVSELGVLSKGNWADFVVLDQDPTKDIRNTRQISSVWIAGNRVSR